ncbi:MAG: lysophospholipid acyltransferase family protein [Fibrobacter sp.]|nr:lysophospholipid acyltransferase family protein [Fibrobacter sp.]
MMWITAYAGYSISRLLLPLLSFFYALFDFSAKRYIREFRTRLGVSTNFTDYYRQFNNFGTSLIDRYFYMFDDKDHFTYERVNERIITGQLDKGNGAILLGAHIGDWQMAGSVLDETIPKPINLLRFDVDSDEVKKLSNKAPKKRNINYITISGESPSTVIEIVNALKRGEVVCLLGDRVLGGQQSEKVPFMGAYASFPTGPFAIAAATNVPLIPFFSIKTGYRKYTFIAYEPISVRYSSLEQKKSAINDAMLQYVKILEDIVSKYPYQWYNFYKFWD